MEQETKHVPLVFFKLILCSNSVHALTIDTRLYFSLAILLAKNWPGDKARVDDTVSLIEIYQQV